VTKNPLFKQAYREELSPTRLFFKAPPRRLFKKITAADAIGNCCNIESLEKQGFSKKPCFSLA
jgi:hypothetical protein